MSAQIARFEARVRNDIAESRRLALETLAAIDRDVTLALARRRRRKMLAQAGECARTILLCLVGVGCLVAPFWVLFGPLAGGVASLLCMAGLVLYGIAATSKEQPK